VLIWSLFISAFMLRKAMAPMLEPYATQAVVMGAADRLPGAFLLLWYPAASTSAGCPPGSIRC
jgi:hypothetical protein